MKAPIPTLSNFYKAIFIAYMGIMSIGMNATPHMWLVVAKILLLMAGLFVVTFPIFVVVGVTFMYLSMLAIVKLGWDSNGNAQDFLNQTPVVIKHEWDEITNFISKIVNKVV